MGIRPGDVKRPSTYSKQWSEEIVIERILSMDSLWLWFWGIVGSALSWAFWYYTGEHGFQIITAAVLITLVFDNRRMRKQIEQYEQQNNGSKEAYKHDQANNQSC